MERWPLVEVRMFIYIVLKPKDWCLLGLLFPSQPCPRYNSLKFPKLENYTFISKVNRKDVFLTIRSNLSTKATLETEESGRCMERYQ